MRILFKFATRSRPQKFFACLENIVQKVDDKYNFKILVSIDRDDKTIHLEEFTDLCYEITDRFYICRSYSYNKVDAINRDLYAEVQADTFDILINTSDDMIFTRHGFDNIIRADMIKNFPDLDGFLHYNDGNQKSNVCTMSIMGRKYYERFGYIYNPAYKSVWCDVEQTEVAYMLGKYKYMGDENILFRHNHPAWGLAEWDEQYRKSDDLNVWGEDLKTLIERRARNYDLKQDEIINPYLYTPQQAATWKSDLNATRIHHGMEAINF